MNHSIPRDLHCKFCDEPSLYAVADKDQATICWCALCGALARFRRVDPANVMRYAAEWKRPARAVPDPAADRS